MITEYSIELWAVAVSDYMFFDRDYTDLQAATEMLVYHLMNEEG